jgi:GNAT superfamily N-acetyltransferase
MALVGGRLAGICLMVLHELDPEFRGQGVARRLVAAIEDHARRQGVARLHLHTVDADELYRKCGWAVAERFATGDAAMVLMRRDLQNEPISSA